MNEKARDILHGWTIDERLLPWPAMFIDEAQPVKSSRLYLFIRCRYGGLHDDPYSLASLGRDKYVLSIYSRIRKLLQDVTWPRVEYPNIIPVIIRLVIVHEFNSWWGREEEIPFELSDRIITRTVKELIKYTDKVARKYEEEEYFANMFAESIKQMIRKKRDKQ